MDLVSTVRKEGSRGGRGDFKWSDVESSTHREHYLGHSLMAPVGRWQKGRDLNWYAKGAGDEDADGTSADVAAKERKEEIRKIKEAEQDALARALGFDVAPRNPNAEALANDNDVKKILKEATEDDERDGTTTTGLGYGGFGGLSTKAATAVEDRLEGNAEAQDVELRHALREYRRRHGDGPPRKRSRSRSREHRRDQTKLSRPDSHRRRHHRSRSHDRDRRRRDRNRSRSRSRSRSGSHDRRTEKVSFSHRSDPRRRSRSPSRRDKRWYAERHSDQWTRRNADGKRRY